MTLNLKRELKRMGLSQRDLARAINCEEATVSRYANGLKMTDYHERRALEVLSPGATNSTPGRVTVKDEAAA